MNIEDDPLYREAREGYVTESTDGATAMLEIFVIVFIKIPFYIVAAIVRLFR